MSDIVDIPQPVTEFSYGPPKYQGKVVRQYTEHGGSLYLDTETGGVCLVRRDSSFRTSFDILRFDSEESFEIWSGAGARLASPDIRSGFCPHSLKANRIEREWVERETFGILRKKGRYEYFCRCHETGERLSYPNEVTIRYSKSLGYLPFRKTSI